MSANCTGTKSLGTSPANKNQENGRNRLVAYARRWPEHCQEVDDDGWGLTMTFEIGQGPLLIPADRDIQRGTSGGGEEVCEGTQYR